MVLPVFRYRPIGVRDPRPMRGHAVVPDTQQRSNKEVIGCERSSRDGRACCTPRQCWPPSCSRPAPGTSLTRGLTGARPERKGTRCFERSRTPWARSPFWRWLWAPGSSPAKGHTYHHEAFVAAGPSPGDREGLVAYVDRQERPAAPARPNELRELWERPTRGLPSKADVSGTSPSAHC